LRLLADACQAAFRIFNRTGMEITKNKIHRLDYRASINF
jgi:hypothetical protein